MSFSRTSIRRTRRSISAITGEKIDSERSPMPRASTPHQAKSGDQGSLAASAGSRETISARGSRPDPAPRPIVEPRAFIHARSRCGAGDGPAREMVHRANI